MAIDTKTKKLSMMEWCQVWEPGLPLSPGTLGTDDQQQLLWGYPGIAWGAPPEVEEGVVRGPFLVNVGRLMG